MSKDLPHFEAPPISEVVMGLKFDQIPGFLVTHPGLFWSLIKNEFAKSEEASPLIGVKGLATSNVSSVPLPRAWLIHKDEQYLIQLQSDIFYFNWRRRNDTGHEYPRYESIKPLFYMYWKKFAGFLKSEQLAVPENVTCELTYVNLIPETNGGGIDRAFPDIRWRRKRGRFLPKPRGTNWRAAFPIMDGEAEITASVQSGTRRRDEHPFFKFEIIARDLRNGSPVSSTEEWFDRAHESIVWSFVDLTNESLQRNTWKRIYD